jgi:hypothetical protein
VSEDPAQPFRRTNQYAYSGGDPVNNVDPSGLFSCQWHIAITQVAAMLLGYNPEAALALGQQVCDVDQGTQSTNPDDTHIHAMAGRKGKGKFESPERAHQGSEDLLGNLGTNGDLAKALHLVQDQWPIGHRYKPWGGPFNWPDGTGGPIMGPIIHFTGDYNPSADVINNALNSTYQYLRDYLNRNLKDPLNYLPSPCK